MKGWRTILIGSLGLAVNTIAAIAAEPALVSQIQSASAFAMPIMMVVLRVLTTGPIGNK